MEDAAVGFARDLVRSGEDPDAVLTRCADALADAGFTCSGLEDAGALVARRGPDPRLVLAGHVDTVPVAGGWSMDPRGGEVRGGALWGRGSADMLGAVACFLAVATDHPDLELAVALTTDEESGMEGAGALAESGLLGGAEAVVLGEPTDLALGLAHRGVLWMDLHLHGEAAHASMPREGRNALRLLTEAVARLDALDLPGPRDLLPGTTLEPTQVSGGTARNQVPDAVTCGLDCRFPPPATPHDLAGRVDAALQDLPHDLEVVFALPPFEGDPDGPLASVAGDALDTLGLPRAPVGLPFGTEAGRYGVLGVDQIVLGPGAPPEAHTSHEHVDVAALGKATELYARIAEAYQSGGAGAGGTG